MRMHRPFLLAVPVLALFLASCSPKAQNGECKTSEDCAGQDAYGKTCVEGRCQECGQDTDCKAGFVCRSLRCLPRPECERSDDCPSGKACQTGKCTDVAPPPVTSPPPECTNDSGCTAGQACQSGKCVTSLPSACPPGGGKLLSVYFEYDRAVISADSQSDLLKNAACIKDKGFHQITVEGNCDDRGTVDYNLQLGQRRAEAAKKFLVNLGVPASAIKTVSYGKERPICTDNSEDCWKKNRRDDVVVK